MSSITAATHKILLIFQTQINAQAEELKAALKEVRQTYRLERLSSVYLAYSPTSKPTNPSGRLSVAATFLVEENPIQVQRRLSAGLSQNPHSAEITLALFDDETIMSPDLTVPHPELHVRPDWLIPASEIWGDYPHPILNRSLQDISADAEWTGWGQFYTQGSALLLNSY